MSHLSQQILDRVREHGRQIGQKPGHAVADVDHPYVAGAAGARLEFGNHRGVDPRGDDPGYRSQSVRSLEPGSFEHDAFVLGAEGRITQTRAGVDDGRGMRQIDAAVAKRCEGRRKRVEQSAGGRDALLHRTVAEAHSCTQLAGHFTQGKIVRRTLARVSAVLLAPQNEFTGLGKQGRLIRLHPRDLSACLHHPRHQMIERELCRVSAVVPHSSSVENHP